MQSWASVGCCTTDAGMYPPPHMTCMHPPPHAGLLWAAPQVRVRVDGQESKPRAESRENVNKQSVIYHDDKPHAMHVSSSAYDAHVSSSCDMHLSSSSIGHLSRRQASCTRHPDVARRHQTLGDECILLLISRACILLHTCRPTASDSW